MSDWTQHISTDDTLATVYAKLRKPSFHAYSGGRMLFISPASFAVRNARVLLQWRDMEGYFHECDGDEDEDAIVRVRTKYDEYGEALDFDCCETPEDMTHEDNPYRITAREYRGITCRHKAETIQRVERDGMYGVIAEYRDPLTGEWEEAEWGSCWGFIGDDWKDDYALDAMRSAMASRLEAERNAAQFNPSLLFEEVSA